jgi:hypothetical protein
MRLRKKHESYYKYVITLIPHKHEVIKLKSLCPYCISDALSGIVEGYDISCFPVRFTFRGHIFGPFGKFDIKAEVSNILTRVLNE